MNNKMSEEIRVIVDGLENDDIGEAIQRLFNKRLEGLIKRVNDISIFYDDKPNTGLVETNMVVTEINNLKEDIA